MYYTYVLLSKKDGNFYTGFTKDIKSRPARLNPAKLGCKAAFNRVKAAPKRRSGFNEAPEATGVDLLRSMSFTARCDKTREIPKNISGKNVPKEQAQILFDRVNFGESVQVKRKIYTPPKDCVQ